MRLYRGIAVRADEADRTVEEIRETGLLPGNGDRQWTMRAHNLKPRLSELWNLSVLTEADLEPPGPVLSWDCACADEAGAMHYAVNRNRTLEKQVPLLITLEAEIPEIVVDGRDFLFALFQLGDPAKARPLAEGLFGAGILRYVDRAWSTDDDFQRRALCRLAVQDDDVIAAHAGNRVVIGGRYSTIFCSAFLVRTPLPPERIVEVRLLEDAFEPPEPEIMLEMIR